MLLFTQRRLLQYDKLSKGKSRDAINKTLSISCQRKINQGLL